MYRSFRNGDENAIIDLWNKTMQRDPITKQRFFKQVLLDANFDPEGLIVAEQDGELIGAIYALTRKLPMAGIELERDTAWITFFMVDPENGRQGIVHGLMEQAEQYAKQQGAVQILFSSYAPNYFLPGIDETAYPAAYTFLLKEGYRRQSSPVAMHRDLLDYSYTPAVSELKKQREAEGYSFGPASHGDFPELIRFANEHFNPDWGRAIREGILQGLDPEQVLAAKNGDRIVGFAMFGGYEGIRERFGPFGVDEHEKGKGLGKILLHDTLHAMKQRTIQGAWFLWTSETSSAGHLYLKHGFKTYRQFHVMVKELVH
ncbi:GNAT family N-acetyltransferase [Metaplanococcus flavidus]|uniref:GNAT family N-acetyltransferase n=1 Tax=Metaplanococcus flavidus TaxID=569883 RepID=A0ABW3L9T4_9BACL